MTSDNHYPIKTRRVTVTDKKTGTKYIEERQYQYDPIKKYNRVISSRRVGEKILKDASEPVRCRPKKKATSDATVLEAKRVRSGATDLLQHAGRISGLDAAARAAYRNGGTAEKLLSVAQYLVASGDTVHNVEAWQCEHDLPYEEGLSEDVCYRLFEELGIDESGMQSLFKELAAINAAGKQPTIAFDSTSHSVYADGLKPFARQGFNKDGDGLDTYKIISFFSLDSGLPVSFEIQPGNIPDVSSLFNALTRAKCYGLQNPEFLLDNGFFSKGNVLRFLRSNVKFTILATLSDSWIYKHLDAEQEDESRAEEKQNEDKECNKPLRDGFTRYASQCPFDPQTSAVSTMKMTPFQWTRQRSRNGTAAGSKEEKSFRLYYHYYLNSGKATLEATAFNDKLRRYEQTIEAGIELDENELKFAQTYFTWKKVRGNKIKVTPNEEAIAEARKDFGVFVLVSNLHSDPWEALRRYRQRNEIETSYRTVKSELDGRRIRVWTMRNVRGKELCRHVALGYRFTLLKLLEKTVKQAKSLAQSKDSSAADRNLYERVASWAEELTIKQMLDWFDCVERVSVKNPRAQYRWATETTKRDRAFLDLFYQQTL